MEIFFIFIGLSFWAGLLWEMHLHPNYNLSECIRRFKADIYVGLCALFSTDVVRHVFSDALTENFLNVLSEYYHTAFDPTFQVLFLNGVPLIQICFVPSRKYEKTEFMRLCHLLKLKFSQYLMVNRLNWNYFLEFHEMNDSVIINIFYSEFESDKAPFRKQYIASIKQAASPDFGVLRDKELEQELKRVQ